MDPNPKWGLGKGINFLMIGVIELTFAILSYNSDDRPYKRRLSDFAIPAIVMSSLCLLLVIERIFKRHMELEQMRMKLEQNGNAVNSNNSMTSVVTAPIYPNSTYMAAPVAYPNSVFMAPVPACSSYVAQSENQPPEYCPSPSKQAYNSNV
jgi:hypothetical protein